jgi:hypothetical protein
MAWTVLAVDDDRAGTRNQMLRRETMAKAVQCDVCRRLVAQKQAAGWRTITMSYQEMIVGETIKDEFDPRVDVCSRACAEQWFAQVMNRCFPVLEHQVGA